MEASKLACRITPQGFFLGRYFVPGELLICCSYPMISPLILACEDGSLQFGSNPAVSFMGGSMCEHPESHDQSDPNLTEKRRQMKVAVIKASRELLPKARILKQHNGSLCETVISAPDVTFVYIHQEVKQNGSVEHYHSLTRVTCPKGTEVVGFYFCVSSAIPAHVEDGHYVIGSLNDLNPWMRDQLSAGV
jgi:hypothetical protein